MDARFIAALLVTIVVEAPLLIAGVQILAGVRRPPLPKVLFAGCFASVASLPYLWFLLPQWLPGNAYIPVGEGLVIVMESIVFGFVLELRYLHCLMLSLVCNASSLVVGLALVRVLAW